MVFGWERPLGRDKVERFLAEVLWEREGKPYGAIIRGKGLLWLEDCTHMATLQM